LLSREEAVRTHHLHPITLDAAQRAQLEDVSSHGRSSARRILRAHILLTADCGPAGPCWTDTAIAAAFAVSGTTIARVRREFAQEGLAVIERRRPQVTRPHKLDGAQEAHLIALACSAPPTGHARWTLRLLAERFVLLDGGGAVSYEHIRQLLKKAHSSPG
jgi:transposase